jgi:YgiT-type zinc finger domain-containing protein
MSSSPRSSPNKRRPATSTCPSCQRSTVIEVEEDVCFQVGRKRLSFSAVKHERCTACGERIFDVETARRFDAAVLPRRRRPAA